MEAMTIGSPQSPATPVSPGAHGAQSPFLPPYLLGGEPTPAANTSVSRLWSTSTASSSSPQRQAGGLGKASAGHSPAPGYHGSPQVFQSPRSDMRRDIIGKEKAGGPPVHGLIESFTSPNNNRSTTSFKGEADTSRLGLSTPGPHSFNQSAAFGTPATGTPGTSVLFGRKTPPSPAQVDPFYTQGEGLRPDDELDETWVTVFGFPPAATSFILQQFSQYGNILKHVISPDGNWMHLRYQSKLQAKKALSKNSKIFGGSIMVGVTHCIDKVVMENNRNADSSILKSSYLGGGDSMSTPRGGCNQTDTEPGMNVSCNTSIRPLTAAYRAASNEHQVIPQGNTPQKNNGVVSKAMEYMFGW